MPAALALSGLAAAIWFWIFAPPTAGLVNFWANMAAAAGLLAAAALYLQRAERRRILAFATRHVWIGLGAAALLYFAFLAGSRLSTSLFAFAAPQISAVYSTRAQAPPWLIGPLLLLWIGPAEEVFWRGFVQDRLANHLGDPRGYALAALLYAGVHVWALNPMLLAAAAICGLFWGALYWRYRSLWPSIISHAVWDVLVFVLLPLR
jgi:membrane protease YdiL (CAAX protease family)